jgi:glycosyltransferase involved in cell wall biosynthesis
MSVRVSVIIPNYNHVAYLKQRIESVLQQTFHDFEIIILDDCSTDGSADVIRQYEKHPLVQKVIYNEMNSGNPFRQWKKGIEQAQGEWIWFAESDDYADVKFLDKMLAAADQHPNAGLVYCDSHVVTGSRVEEDTFATLKDRRYHTTRWSENYSANGIQEIEDFLLDGGTINNSSAVLFKKQVLERVNPFDITFRYIGDKYAFVKTLSVSDVAYVKEPLNYYRDPFNTKHVDRFIFYFYEQFIVFSWALKNLPITNKKKFFDAFYANTRNSLFRDWNLAKLKLYGKLFRLNPSLLIKNIVYNFREGVASGLGWRKS